MAEDEGVTVVSYLDHVIMTLDDITNEKAVPMLAMRVQERAQLNIRSNDQIDTGFMVNSIYTVLPDKSDYNEVRNAAEAMTRSTRDWRLVDQSDSMAPEVRLERNMSAGVVVGANYAIYQEVQNAFMAPAAEAAGAEMGAQVAKIYSTYTKDESGNWRATGKKVL